MGKEKPGFLTAKAFSNRIKSKGLQKLRWFCQLCQKQCRDENGFKCHISSESHHRQMMLFDENKDSVMSEYTRQFMRGYLDILKRQFGGKRTLANVIYQEYIKDKSHVHMNSTKFTTLTGFINCLQKMNLCKVDQTDKGWFIEYIAVDPETEHREKKKLRMEQSATDEEKHYFDLINKLRKNAAPRNDEVVEFSALEKSDEEKISLCFSFQEKTIKEEKVAGCSSWDDQKEEPVCKKSRASTELSDKSTTARKMTVLEEIKIEQERLKERTNRKNYWLHENIIVRLVDKHLPSELLDQEVHVRQLEDRYTAVVRTLGLASGNKKMKIKQEHVMTVVPPVGHKVLLVNGGYRGYTGKILSLDKRRLTADVQLVSGIHTGMKLNDVSYDDISKIFEQS